MADGPVTQNLVLSNRLVDNRHYGLTVGGYGHSNTKMSLFNVFASNVIQGNARDQTPSSSGKKAPGSIIAVCKVLV
jgi:hypothetical protein